MSKSNTPSASEFAFQNDIIQQLQANGWQLGKPEGYNRKLALYEEDVLGFVKDTQDDQWQKFCALYPNDTEQKFLQLVATQLNKANTKLSGVSSKPSFQ